MDHSSQEVVIVSACRTPIAKFGGSLKDLRAYELAGIAMEEALKRAGISGEDVDEVIAGDCIQCADEANTARNAALSVGIPVEVPAYTVQKQCSSSMQALSSARAQILAGDTDTVLVVGTESMSNGPYLLPTARWGQRLQDGRMVDSVWEILHSGSSLIGPRMIMGQTAENLAEIYSISREEQDEIALRSNHNAEAATKSGRFAEEIVPVTVKGSRGDTVVDTDEHTRFDMKMGDLSRLRPIFKDDGTVTVGNSSGLNDGAAAAVVMKRSKAQEMGIKPLVRIVNQASVGVRPEIMGYGPVPATEKVLARAGMGLGEIGLVEINEAFAAQYLACEKGLGLDRRRTNVNGSGIGLGHPIGATGLRIVVSLIHEMKRRDERYGLAALCVGGGMGMATVVELL